MQYQSVLGANQAKSGHTDCRVTLVQNLERLEVCPRKDKNGQEDGQHLGTVLYQLGGGILVWPDQRLLAPGISWEHHGEPRAGPDQ